MVLKERNVRMSNDDKRYARMSNAEKQHAIEKVYQKDKNALQQDLVTQRPNCKPHEAISHCESAKNYALRTLGQCPTTAPNIFNWLRRLAIFHKDASVELERYLPTWQSKVLLDAGKSQPPSSLALVDIINLVEEVKNFAQNNIFQRLSPSQEPTQEKIHEWLQDLYKRKMYMAILNQLFQQHQEHFHTYAKTLTNNNESDAKDIVQEGLAHALHYLIHSAEVNFPEENKFKAWMRCIIRHAFLDERRKNSTGTASLEELLEQQGQQERFLDPDASLEEQVTNRESWDQLKNLLGAADLSPQHYEIMKRSFFHNASATEIAKELDIAIETVRSTIKRKRRDLLQTLPPKILEAYLQERPQVKLRMLNCIKTYKGRTAAETLTVKYILGLYVSGMDAREIAHQMSDGSESPVMSLKGIQTLLSKHLPKLFEAFLKKEKQAGKEE